MLGAADLGDLAGTTKERGGWEWDSASAECFIRVPGLWTVKEVASQLRFSTGHVYELVRSGQLRGIRHGRTIRIPHEALTEWQAANPAGYLDERRSVSGESGADARTTTDGARRVAQRDRSAVRRRGR